MQGRTWPDQYIEILGWQDQYKFPPAGPVMGYSQTPHKYQPDIPASFDLTSPSVSVA